INSLPKYVVSTTLRSTVWHNTTVLAGDVVDQVAALKQDLHGDIVVWASFKLVRVLLDHDLVDELRLKIYPVVLGDGERLFDHVSERRTMRLVDSRTVDSDVVLVTYDRLRPDS
ncbi:MAG TPA: dihydrofolate reductase family protein, partial [Candidatus Dormibacteraeota bacterium]|nr:dihydrofolate reductase family protein [Candidatus Dormibacteraeota bacterium]